MNTNDIPTSFNRKRKHHELDQPYHNKIYYSIQKVRITTTGIVKINTSVTRVNKFTVKTKPDFTSLQKHLKPISIHKPLSRKVISCEKAKICKKFIKSLIEPNVDKSAKSTYSKKIRSAFLKSHGL
jgi:hypothetical protein